VGGLGSAAGRGRPAAAQQRRLQRCVAVPPVRGRLRLKEELPRRAEPPRFRPARAGRLRSGRLPLFDCPGQIGLYTHLPVLRPLADGVLRKFTTPCAASTSIDSQFIADASRVPSASQVSLSAIMMSLELPRINVLPKVDILQKCERKKVDRFPGFPNGRRRGLISHSQAGHYQELPGTTRIFHVDRGNTTLD
jgi:hypothetical protein